MSNHRRGKQSAQKLPRFHTCHRTSTRDGSSIRPSSVRKSGSWSTDSAMIGMRSPGGLPFVFEVRELENTPFYGTWGI
ncbi:unnamed protein product [Linum trigynum]|uniref:Uncharacterized protein n=2 Tax=Linum TaxID=4005 RepID=A0AAV2EP04_9ROSI